MITTALANFLIVLAIGIAVGLLMNRYGRSWVGRRVAETTGIGDVTYALVGIAGAFIGFHLGVVLGLLPSPLMLYIAAAAGAAVTVLAWRGR